MLALGLLSTVAVYGQPPRQPPLGMIGIEQPQVDSVVATSDFGWDRAASTSTVPLGRKLLAAPLSIRHADPNDPARHVGLGHPLVGTSWRNRPFHLGWQFGGMSGDPLLKARVSQDEGIYGGYQIGWDFDHYWGTELRLGFTNLDLTDRMPLVGPGARTSRDQFWDLNLMYYPWGDARWRPFVSLGIGAGNFYFLDDASRSVRETVFTVPVGAGIKYYYRNWLAWRLSVTDQWSPAAQGLSEMHNIAVTAGVEVHFGGSRVSYFP